MTEKVHIIPVGFDYERLLHPISKGDLDADRVRLVDGKRDDTDDSVLDLADRMLRELRYTFENHFDVEVEVAELDGIYDYRGIYESAYEMLHRELRDGNEVWVNISSMPRTVAFAFAAAGNTHVAENPGEREQLHTYYVRPEKYFAPEMIDQLQKEAEFLKQLENDEAKADIADRRQEIDRLVEQIERSGVTKGAKVMDDGKRYVEFPATPLPDLRDFEVALLKFLAKHGTMRSTSELAREFGRKEGMSPEAEDFESFRSKVQYNVDKLEDKGYIERHEQDNRHETTLSVTGELWVKTHTSVEPVQDDEKKLEI
jgi:hypothetical protein